MKFLPKINLTLAPEEITLLKKVFKISLALFVIIIVSAWLIQRASLKKSTANGTQAKKSVENDLSALFGSKNGDLLPIDIEAHEFAARMTKEEMNYDKTIKHLLRILSADPKNRKFRVELGTTYLKATEYGKAEALLRELDNEGIADSLTDPIMSRFGLALFYQGKIEESIAQLEKTVGAFPASKEAYCYSGQIEASINLNSEKAEKYLKKAIELDPKYSEALYQLARYYMNKPQASDADYNNARIYLQKQLDIEPLNAKVHSRLGMTYYYLHEPYLAEKSYSMALTLNENDYNTHYNLGELYYSQLNDRLKALEQFKKAAAIKRDHAEANFKIGLIALENQQYKEAIRFLQLANAQAPSNTRILLQLGVAYERLGMREDAIGAYTAILNLDALNDIALQKLKLMNTGQ